MAQKNDILSTRKASDDDFGMMINFAVRYALGRQTYAVSEVTSFVTPLIPYLNDKTLWCLDRDIEEQGRIGSYGDPNIDAPVWMRFLEKVKQELSQRNELKQSSNKGG